MLKKLLNDFLLLVGDFIISLGLWTALTRLRKHFNDLDFYSKAIIFLVLIATIIVFTVPKTKKTIDPSEYTIYKVDPVQITFPIDVYFHKDFNNQDILAANKAIASWQKATKGVVRINPHYYWDPEVEFDYPKFMFYKNLNIWKLKYENHGISGISLSHSMYEIISAGKFLVILDTQNNAKNMQTIFTHELGHFIGLKDLKKKYDGAMYVDGNGGKITKYDLQQVCFLYGMDCKKAKLKY